MVIAVGPVCGLSILCSNNSNVIIKQLVAIDVANVLVAYQSSFKDSHIETVFEVKTQMVKSGALFPMTVPY
jgi:hypothetical protein